jgi:hypothetical protein
MLNLRLPQIGELWMARSNGAYGPPITGNNIAEGTIVRIISVASDDSIAVVRVAQFVSLDELRKNHDLPKGGIEFGIPISRLRCDYAIVP